MATSFQNKGDYMYIDQYATYCVLLLITIDTQRAVMATNRVATTLRYSGCLSKGVLESL